MIKEVHTKYHTHSTHGGTTNCMEVLTLEFGVDSTARKPKWRKRVNRITYFEQKCEGMKVDGIWNKWSSLVQPKHQKDYVIQD